MQKVSLVLGALILFIAFIFFVPRGVPVVAPAAGSPFAFWVSSVPQIERGEDISEVSDEGLTTLLADRGYLCGSTTKVGEASSVLKIYIQGQQSRTTLVSTASKTAKPVTYDEIVTGGFEYVWTNEPDRSPTRRKVLPRPFPYQISPGPLKCKELHVNPSLFVLPSNITFIDRIPGSR